MYSTEGIILKKFDSGEADAIVTIYTKDYGKIRAVAQGVKKEGAKLKGHLEPLNVCLIGFVLGKNNGERLIHAGTIRAWSRIREDKSKVGLAIYLLELVQRHCLAGEKDTALWGFLLKTLFYLEDNELSEPRVRILKNLDREFLTCLGYGEEQDIRILGVPVPKPFF